MSGDGFELTPEQEAAVKHRGSALLVSAAAGSGKTKVLVEHLLDRIEDGDSIDEFLVITYTRAAASELRERIYDELLNRIAENTDNRRLRRQLMLCGGARIGTIHSLCTDLLRENAYAANITPYFRVLDENESEIIKTLVLEDVLDRAYETIETSEGFRALIDATMAGRDDRRLISMILDSHTKLQSNPDPERWVKDQTEKLTMSGVSDISETVWGKYLIDKTRGRIQHWQGETVRLRRDMKIHPDFEKAYGSGIEAVITDAGSLLDALDRGWEEARRYSNIIFPRANPIKGYDDLKSIRRKCKAELEKCTDVFACSSAEHIEDMEAVAPAIAALLQLIMDFDVAYSEEKRNRGAVDFSDLEHLTLSLLIDNNTGERTESAKAISGRFKEIMVDEYQDVNAIQELIFNAVSDEGNNIFMVGDVKQSIYRFRLADPSIFLGKYKGAAEPSSGQWSVVSGQWSGDEGDEDGIIPFRENIATLIPNSEFRIPNSPVRVVLLSKNFRSRTGILDFVNFVFGSIMSEEFGEIDYTERERLIPGREDEGRGQGSGTLVIRNSEFGIRNEGDEGTERRNAECRIQNAEIEDVSYELSGTDAPVELDIIDMSNMESDEGEESPVKTQVEARFIAERILEIINGDYHIPNGRGGMSRAGYSDIVVLLRSMSGKAKQYADVLSEYGIPVEMPGSEDFFETVEVSAALSLLSVIDNPIQDIYLAAVLRGPVYGFSADELAEIRAEAWDTDYYGALTKAAESNSKCAAFLDEIDALRTLSPDMSAFRFIWYVYNKTGLLEWAGAMRGGNKRRNNLLLLAEYARRFEQSGYKGLFDFLTYMRSLQDKGVELAGYDAAISNDVVRIMSIHKSKGLEFPIVFLADTSKQFNYKDTQKPLVLHPEFGVGVKRIDRHRRIEYPTIARMAVQSKIKAEMLAEELRVLYVAMTRAKEKLIITATFKDAEKEIRNSEFGIRHEGNEGSGDPVMRDSEFGIRNPRRVPPQALEDIKHMAGWILAALGAAKPRNAEWRSENSEFGIRNSELSGTSWVIRQISAETKQNAECRMQNAEIKIRNSESRIPNSLPIDVLSERGSFVYPHGRAPELPSKLTVTELKGRLIDVEASGEAETVVYAGKSEARKRRFELGKPDFIRAETGLTAAERGTALHLVMQYIDFNKCGDAAGVGDEILRLTQKGFLTKEQADAVEAQKITRFFESDIGKRVLKANNIKREFKFSLLCPAERFYTHGGDDRILFQGIVDCFFEEDGELVLVDFKTDRVTKDTIEDRVSNYTPQLTAYSDALERITGKHVKERVIYFLTPDTAYYV